MEKRSGKRTERGEGGSEEASPQAEPVASSPSPQNQVPEQSLLPPPHLGSLMFLMYQMVQGARSEGSGGGGGHRRRRSKSSVDLNPQPRLEQEGA